MKKWMLWAGAAAAVVVLAGGFYLTRTQTTAGRPERPRDPGFAVVLAIRTLERSPETRLSKEQIARILPFIKALKDVPASDEASAIIARGVRDVFTPQQRAALEDARRRFQQRQAGAAPDGAAGVGGETAGPRAGRVPGAGAGPGAGVSDEQRAQFRTVIFERMIRHLERRMR
jgi:hypothetical protein